MYVVNKGEEGIVGFKTSFTTKEYKVCERGDMNKIIWNGAMSSTMIHEFQSKLSST